MSDLGSAPKPGSTDSGEDTAHTAEQPATDAALLTRHRQGDPEAFAELVSEYRRPVYSYLSRSGVEAEERDDLFQEIFLRIHRSADSFDGNRPLHPWVFTIVANAVRNHLRRRRVRQLLFDRGPAKSEPPDPAPSGDHQVQTREAVAWLETAVQRLPLEQREVLLLSCVEGLPLKGVAESLRCPLNTVKTRLRRARLSLLKARAKLRAEIRGTADLAIPD